MGVDCSTQKTKGIVMREEVCDRDMGSVHVDRGEIERVDCFMYLRSSLSRD